MSQNKNNNTSKKNSQQPERKANVGSPNLKRPRPEIDLPIKGGKRDSDSASKKPSNRDAPTDFDMRSMR